MSSVNLYGIGASGVSLASSGAIPVVQHRPPASSDVQGNGGPYVIGQQWIDITDQNSYQLVGLSTHNGVVSATWTALGGGSSSLSTLSGDTGTAAPIAGNIQIAGGTGVTTAASGGVVTITATGADNTFSADSGTAVPSAGVLQLNGGNGILTSASGNLVTFTVVPADVIRFNGDSSFCNAVSGIVTFNGTSNQITTTGNGSGGMHWALASPMVAPGSVSATGTLSATTTITAGTGITCTTGNINATNGSVIMGGTSSLFSAAGTGNGLQVVDKNSSTACCGTATLSSGSVVVTTSYCTTTAVILLTVNNTATSGSTISPVAVNAQSNGSFTIKSSSGSDSNQVNWMIIK